MRAFQSEGVSEQRACKIVGCPRGTARYRSRRPIDQTVLPRLRELAARYRRFGYRKLDILLRREGLVVNHKRLYRIYEPTGSSWLASASDMSAMSEVLRSNP